MRRNSFGFTLVEIVIVLLLLGIVSAVAVPSINSTLDTMKIDAAAREVVSAIQYAQSLAIKEGGVYGVKFSPLSNSFSCYKNVSGNTILNPLDKKAYVVDFDEEGHFQGIYLASVNFSSKREEFNSLGEPSESGSVILRYAGHQKTISVSMPLGNVSVQ